MTDVVEFCERAAREAASVLMSHYGRLRRVDKKGKRDLVTAADREAEDLVIRRIREAFPGDAVLAEETLHGQGAAPRLWILDPLDGTTNFVYGIPHFGPSLAFYENGVGVVGCVYNPALDECYVAVAGGGAKKNGRPLKCGSANDLSEALLTTGFPYRIDSLPDNNLRQFSAFATRVRGLRRLGSAALDLCYAAEGRYDGFWEMHLSPWDVAAGAVVAREAGCVVSDFDGGENWLFGGRIAAANPALHAR
ncbi:MAG TPA: inositol monophosphatase family protein, partial [Planctomycetota bacterium]|nr:inositol monophosphatase family protein [Planctomycetota bacterium]